MELEIELVKLSESQQDVLAPLHNETKPPNRHGVRTAWVQALDEKAASSSHDFDRKARSSVCDANACIVNALRAHCADDAANTRAAYALRSRSRIRRHQQRSYSGWPGEPDHTLGANGGPCRPQMMHDSRR